MKSFICAIALMAGFTAYSQNAKWFVSFSTGGNFGGPGASLKSKMNKQGFNQESSFNFLGWTGTTQYPRKEVDPYALIRFGFRMKERKSLFFVAGLAEQGTVSGFKNLGYSDFLGILGSSDGPLPSMQYSLYQLSGGLQYDNVKTRAKLGFAPSLFVMRYALNEENKKSAIMPGAFLTGRFTIGKEKKLFGLEIVLDMRLAPPVHMKNDVTPETGEFRAGSVNICSGSAGIAFCFRK
jgi:hypothetical protein